VEQAVTRNDAAPHPPSRASGAGGFSLMEVTIALAIVGILATLAVPALFAPVVREQVASAAPLVDLAKKPIAKAWATTQTFPADNAAAGLPAADKMVNNYVASVAVVDGVIEVTFGNNAHGELKGKVLTIRPAVVEDAPVVPVAWVCGYAGVPANMTARGVNATSITSGLLPYNCQPPPK
jgi:type IV pilus assembly protein PilA